jgi:MFS family permease
MRSHPAAARTDGVRAWVVIAAATLAAAVALGTVTSHGVLVDALAPAQVLGVAAGALLVGTSSAVQFGLGPAVGALTDRAGIRPTLLLGVLAYSAGAAGAAILAGHDLDGLAVGVYALGTGVAGACTLTPLLATAAAWCVRRRSAALAVLSTGNALGAALLAPLVASLVARDGITAVWHTLAVGGTLALLPAVVLVRDAPGRPPHRRRRPGHSAATVLLDDGLRRFYLAGVVGSAGAITATAYLVPFTVSLGYSPTYAAGLLAASGAIGVVSRLVVTVVPARRAFHAYRASSLALAGSGLAWTLAPSARGWLLVFVVSFGVFAGLWVALAPVVVATTHADGLAAILGALYTAPAFGGLLGPLLVGGLLRGLPLAVVGLVVTGCFGGAALVLRPLDRRLRADPPVAAPASAGRGHSHIDDFEGARR